MKKIGIRKVLGATAADIFGLLSREQLAHIAISNLIAWPLGYFAMRAFLQNYAFRTSLGIEIFFVSAVAAFWIAFLTVFYQAFKAARSNPSDTLKYE
jgi:putative ABC transport system permease protein